MIEKNIQERINGLDWNRVKNDLDTTGFAVLPAMINRAECRSLMAMYDEEQLYRSTINMKRYNFGRGEYKYFTYPLPGIIQSLREAMYPPLSAIANEWYKKLNIGNSFPATHRELLQQCRKKGQERPTPLILKYGEGDFNTLHQDLYGDVFFPLQAVIFLTEPGVDYTGGEFVLVEQRPRLQSRAMVLQPAQGSIVIFTTSFRAAKSAKGYYRAPMRHGVSEVHSGKRYNAGIIFHDAR